MRISTDIAWLLTTALVALRLGVALLLTPLLAFGGVPARFRVIPVPRARRVAGSPPPERAPRATSTTSRPLPAWPPPGR